MAIKLSYVSSSKNKSTLKRVDSTGSWSLAPDVDNDKNLKAWKAGNDKTFWKWPLLTPGRSKVYSKEVFVLNLTLVLRSEWVVWSRVEFGYWRASCSSPQVRQRYNVFFFFNSCWYLLTYRCYYVHRTSHTAKRNCLWYSFLVHVQGERGRLSQGFEINVCDFHHHQR